MKNKILLITFLIAIIVLGCNRQKTELHIYNWSDYISPEVIEKFEKQNNCTVIVDSFDSNESMYAKLKAGASGYDICIPSSYQVDLLAKEGLIEELDHSKIPSVKVNFDKKYESQILDTNLTYSVPYVVTYTGFMYLKDKVDRDEVKSWKILENSKYKGKISLLEDIREVIGAGLMYNGYSLNSEDKKEIEKATQTVLRWKKNIRKFDAESYRTEVPSHTTYIGHGYSSDSSQVIFGEDGNNREDICFILPEEGFTIAFDELVIMKNSQNKDLAYKFIEFLFHKENALENMKYVCGIMPHESAISDLPEQMKNFFIQTDEIMKKGQVLKSFVDKPEIQELYNRAWDQIKAVEK